MGSKGTTTTQQQNQSWGPTQQAADLYGNILGQAQSAASTPYQAYTGELTAGINQQQQLGIDNINAASGVANPYLAQAQNYANQGAAPITAGQIQNYANPYQQQVVQATMGNINETNSQQQQQVVGNAAMKGALGGDRVGVAQSELARQQNLSNNSTLAGLNQAGYQSSLAAAQQDRSAAGQAAYTFGNLGQLAQNTALTGAGAQLGAGTLQQQTSQNADNAAYQQYMQKLAFPYQQTQWLAGIGTGVGSQLGGWSNGNGSSTTENGNGLSQGIGAGLSLLALMNAGGRVNKAEGGGLGGTPFGGAMGYIPQTNMPTAAPMQRPDSMKITPAKTDSGPGLDKLVGQAGALAKGFLEDKPAAPLDISPEGMKPTPTGLGEFSPSVPTDVTGFLGGLYASGGFVDAPGGYADGGAPDDTFNDRWGPYPSVQGGDGVGSLDGAKGLMKLSPVSDSAVQTWRDDNPLPAFAQAEDPRTVPPQEAMSAEGPSIVPDQPTALNPTGGVGGLDSQGNDAGPDDSDVLPPNATPAQHKEAERRGLLGLNLLPDNLRAPLLAAGLGMLSSKSNNVGAAIGEGGLAGLNTYTKQREADRKDKHDLQSNSIQSRRLDQAAEQAQKTLEYRTKVLAETTRQHDYQSMQPVKIGSNIYGDVYGIRDPKTGTIIPIDPKTGRPMGAGAQPGGQPPQQTPQQQPGQVPPLSAPNVRPKEQVADDQGLPLGAKPASYIFAAGSPGGTVNDPIATQYNNEVLTNPENKEVANTVRAIAEGRAAPLPLQRGNRYNQNIMEKVREYNPAYDATLFASRQRTANSFRAGKEGANITSLNTVGQHLDELYKAATDLDNSRIPMFNAAKQFIGWNLGDKKYQDKLKNYNTAVDAVSVEAAKAFMGGGQTALADRQEWKKLYAPTDPLNAQKAAISKTVKLLDGRLNSLTDQYNRGMSTAHDPSALISPQTKKVFDKLRGDTPEAKPATAAPASNIPVGTEKMFKQGLGVWDGSKWTPKQ